jgi:hypothetical protein
MQDVNFMLKTGAIRVKAESCNDLLFPDAHNLSGS